MRSSTACAVVLLALAAWPTTAAAGPELEQARKLLGDLKFRDAEKALDAAWKVKGNARADVLAILEMQGIVAAYLNKPAQASKAFAQLLALDPSWKISDDQPPRVTTPWYEARGRSTDTGALTIKAAKSGVGIEVVDPLRMAARARFHVQRGDVVVPLSQGRAEAAGASGPWWVEVLNENDGVLAALGTEAQPLGKPADAPVKQPPSVADAPSEPVAPAPAVTAQVPAKQLNPVRVVGVVTAVAGAGALVAALLEGLSAEALRKQIQEAPRDAAGRVEGMTQARAAELDAQMQTTATVANVLWISGGVLAGAGLVMIIVGAPTDGPSVALVPAAGGLQVRGAF